MIKYKEPTNINKLADVKTNFDEGTGLGLSLAYDIIMAHGGELTVETTEGEGTSFRINLPKNN